MEPHYSLPESCTEKSKINPQHRFNFNQKIRWIILIGLVNNSQGSTILWSEMLWNWLCQPLSLVSKPSQEISELPHQHLYTWETTVNIRPDTLADTEITAIIYFSLSQDAPRDFFLKSWLSSLTDKKFERFEGFSISPKSTRPDPEHS